MACMKAVKRLSWLVPLALATVGLTGCGAATEGTVSGQVTLDGEPLENGTISFIPADGQTATAGGPIENGRYSLTLEPGPKKVEITATRVVGQRPAYEGDPDSPMIEITESIIPPRYNTQSELTCEIAPGNNTENFELTSGE